MKNPLIFLLFFSPIFLFSQPKSENFGIKNPRKNLSKKCGKYLKIYKKLPVEVRYTVTVEDGFIYIHFPSKHYYELMFNKRNDGFAIDIMERNQYNCSKKPLKSSSWANKGFLMPPMYKREVSRNVVSYQQNKIAIKYGRLPQHFDPLNVECNLLVLQKKYRCGYHSFVNVEFSGWNILEMGLYKDSISMEEFKNQYKEVSKILRFTIPFEKNKTTFSAADIKPLYDSLGLTDYNIKEMSIRAYTSIEGSLNRNVELQKGRAKSILDALQAYQNPEIEYNVSANENWLEFLKDIKDSEFGYLQTLSKEEIKHELKKKSLLVDIETILENHRKAVVELKLQIKFTDQENNKKILKSYFDQNVSEQNLTKALYIQQLIFEKIRENNIPEDFIDQLEVPESSKYGPLLNNFAVFKYEKNAAALYENIESFEKLLSILPDNFKVKYNLTALKIKAWLRGKLYANRNEIHQSISELEKLGAPKSLTRRLRINYFIILTQYLSLENKFKEKNKSLKEVFWYYRKLNLNDMDRLSVAKYLANYSNFKQAEEVLYKRVNELDATEELIFYYLNLTIHSRKKTRQSQYRTFLINAIEKNNRRFCDLFLPVPQGGNTFQLLDNEFLRKTYCENCND